MSTLLIGGLTLVIPFQTKREERMPWGASEIWEKQVANQSYFCSLLAKIGQQKKTASSKCLLVVSIENDDVVKISDYFLLIIIEGLEGRNYGKAQTVN